MEAGTTERFARRHFGKTALGDERRTQRLVRVGAALARGGGGESGGTMTSVIRDWHQAKAAYRLLSRPEVTHRAVIAGHCQQVLSAMEAPGHYLLIEDTTAVAYADPAGTRGLGPIGEDCTRGVWAHSTLVVRSDGIEDRPELLGLLGQRVWARPVPRPGDRRKNHGPARDSDHARQTRDDRESQRWMASLEAAGGPWPDTTWTYVADRESDIYELFQSAWLHGWNYVIRAARPRALAGAWAGSDLFAAAAQGTLRGYRKLELPKERRTARLQVRSTSLRLRGPKRPGGALEDHCLNVVWVQEVDAPRGHTPVHWVLLTDLPVDTLAQCRRVIEIYRCRWLIEEWHKALKTGLKVEASQLSDARRLSALIGILSVVAVFLVQQKLLARSVSDSPLDPTQMDPAMLAVLQKIDPPKGKPTQRWFWVNLAKLGGFLARTGDGDPGWLTLWRGWQTLMILVRGYELANSS
jgi:hypothetical protein